MLVGDIKFAVRSSFLSNGAIFNDLERPLPPDSRSRHYLSLNILETAKDTAIVAIEDE